MKKRRKLLCEHGPVCYAISLWKENCKRTLRDWLGRSHFAKNFEEKTLPYVWKGHMSMMLRPLAGVDMQLQRNKVQNLRLAAKQIDGVVVTPGETFSLWALVGRPTRRKGYLDGLVISRGRLGRGVAGGLCQLANLIHYMVLHTPMKVTELHHHTDALFPDAGRRVPFGTGTSIVYKNCDYRFQNTTPYPVQIKVWLQDGMLMGEIRSNEALKERYRLKEENHHYTKETAGYYRNSFVYQVLSDSDGKELQKIPPGTAQKLLERFPGIRILNAYGPTECTVAVTAAEIGPKEAKLPLLPVGKPKADVKIRIEKNKVPVEDGEPGEIVILGDSVAAGYVLEDPSHAFGRLEGKRSYHTGDIGWMQNGVLYCAGRCDQQVKIQGYRIELQDVEKNLCALPGVDQAVVVCREAADGRALRLIAFVIPKQEDPPTRAEIQALLAHRLPDYMRPSIQLIKNFPLTENGKCDRKRLKEIANGRSDFEIDSGYRK